MRPLSKRVAGALATVLLTFSAGAHAEDPVAGRALFNEGIVLFNKGDFAAACPKFEASLVQFPGLGTRGKLAECYEKQGRYASAWQAYRDVALLATRGGDPTRERVAAERARALEPKLSYLSFVLLPGRDVAGLVVKRAGREIERSKLASAEPVDPGSVSIEVSAPGRKTATAQIAVTIAQYAKFEIPILIPTDAAKTRELPAAPPPAPVTLRVQVDPPMWQKPTGVAIAGAGVVGLTVGALVGLSARSTYERAFSSGGCDRTTKLCDVNGQATVDDARSRATTSTILFGAGTALIVAGAVLYLTAPSSRPRAWHAAPTMVAGGAGIAVGGAL